MVALVDTTPIIPPRQTGREESLVFGVPFNETGGIAALATVPKQYPS
jgi:hypothetical protein